MGSMTGVAETKGGLLVIRDQARQGWPAWRQTTLPPLFPQQFSRSLMLLISSLMASIPPGSVEAQRQGFPAPPVWTTSNSNIVEGALPIIFVPEFGENAKGIDGAVCFDGCGRFMVAWNISAFPSDGPQINPNAFTVLVQRYLPDGTESGVFDRLTKDQPDPPVIGDPELNTEPSVAISPNGNVRVGWIGSCAGCRTGTTNLDVPGAALHSDFLFDQSPPINLAPLSPFQANHSDVSVGMSDGSALVGRQVWSSNGSAPTGILEAESVAAANVIRSCGAVCFTNTWKPSLAMRPNGDYCIVWAEAEVPNDPFTPFNIALRVYNSSGMLIDEIAGPSAGQWVNKPDLEPPSSKQLSPAVAFDRLGNIIVTWDGRDGGIDLRVFARRFHWAGGMSQIVACSEPFTVDNDTTAGVAPSHMQSETHPTVALVQDSLAFPAVNPGRFIIAWNSEAGTASPITTEIHAQYFDSDGRPMGREFRVNQATGVTGTTTLNMRTLAESGQHTIAYGGAGQVAVAWTAFGGDQILGGVFPEFVHYTLLPVGFAAAMDMANPCCKGDANQDNVVDGKDIEPFVNMLLNPPVPLDIFTFCPFDTDNDAALTFDDVSGFVDALLLGACPA